MVSTSHPMLAANYDEGMVVPFALPDPLVCSHGSPVDSARGWFENRRPEILRLFEGHVFGRSPGRPAGLAVSISGQDTEALGGKAIRREAAVTFDAGAPKLNLLIYLPRSGRKRWPVMLGPNYLGNHTVHPDPGITLPDITFVAGMDVALPEGRTTEASRGFQASRWPVERMLERGYAVATFFYGDVFPDRADGRSLSVQPHIEREAGQSHMEPTHLPHAEVFREAEPRSTHHGGSGAVYDWGALATWAWGMSRALDALQEMPDVDAGRVALVGHSRHGKAALWAGALDPRLALVVSNNSGKGGASLARRNFGETVRHLVTRYPHWFTPRYAQYADREANLPIDQHMLLALLAPRPVYVASAQDDLWADPRGEFLAARAAGPVYRLLGADGFAAEEMPAPEVPIMSRIGYHLRRGAHDITAYDWERFVDFADRHMT